MSQQIKILKILEDQGWHCTNEFYAAYIADPRTRLCELKKEGYDLEWRWCQQHEHKRSKEWKLNAKNHQEENPIIEIETAPGPSRIQARPLQMRALW